MPLKRKTGCIRSLPALFLIRNRRKPTSDAPSLLHKYTGLYKYNNVILLSDVAYLDEIFGNLNGVQGCTLAYLVAC